MFFDIFYDLCKKQGVSCKRAAEDIGLSNSITTKWKKTGATPSGDTLHKIAQYFGVSIDFLLGKETKNAPAVSGKGDVLDEVDVAFYGEFKELSDDDKEIVRSMVTAMRQRRGKI
jgi:transcriptional regulator with XRE-family HTH domain